MTDHESTSKESDIMVSTEDRLTAVRQNLTALEAARADLLSKKQAARRIQWILVGIGAVIGVLASLGHPVAGIVVGGITLLAILVVQGVKIAPLHQEYRKRFKSEFIHQLLQAMTDELRYSPDGDPAALTEYTRSELFPTTVDRHHIEDTIFAKMGATDLLASELHTEYKRVTRDKNGRTKTTYHTIFKGLFISADFHKNFRGKTFVRSDVAERHLGQIGRFFQKTFFSSLQLVQLEDVDFEREFVVHSDDQIEARYILTPAAMQRMLALKEKMSANIEFAFLHSRVFLAIGLQKDLFEPDLSQSLNDDRYIAGFLEQVELCLGVVQDLDLNTRLWTKT